MAHITRIKLLNGKTTRIVKSNGRTYFCGVDVAGTLGFDDPFMTLRTDCHEFEQKAVITDGNSAINTFISLNDVLHLTILRGEIDIIAFDRWVDTVVNPASALLDDCEGIECLIE